jgi:filamentous hemagglutinin
LRHCPARQRPTLFHWQVHAVQLTDDLVLYRAGKQGQEFGQWFTRESPDSLAQVRIDSAVGPQWIDPKTGVLTGTSEINTVYAIKIPKGTTIYEGPVGYQGGVHLGGVNTNQVFVPTPWKIPGVQVVGKTGLR